MPIDAVIFDIGDVLECNPRTGWPQRWAQRLGMDAAVFERRRDEVWAPGSVGALGLEEIERRTAVAFGVDHRTVKAMMDDAWAEYVGSLNEELSDHLTGLRPRYKTGMLSNSFVGAREREHEAHGLGDMCDVIVYSHEEGCLKPDPRIYRVVCDRLGVDPEVAVLIDDVSENVEGARAVGMHGIKFVSNQQATAELGELLSQ